MSKYISETKTENLIQMRNDISTAIVKASEKNESISGLLEILDPIQKELIKRNAS